MVHFELTRWGRHFVPTAQPQRDGPWPLWTTILQMMLLTKPVWQNYRPLCFDAEKSNTSSIQKVSWGSHFKNGTRNGSKSLFKVSNCLFWSEEVLFKNVFLVFPDFRPNRFRKTGCFHPGQILGPRWDQWHLKHGDWSSQSSNSSLTLLLFIKKMQVFIMG